MIHGANLFYTKSCLYCHTIDGQGGIRGPDLSSVADRLSRDQMIIRISNGGYNMPAYTYNMKPDELKAIVAFLETRKGGAGFAPYSVSASAVTPMKIGSRWSDIQICRGSLGSQERSR